MKKTISFYENDNIIIDHSYFCTHKINLDFHIHIRCELIFIKSGKLTALMGDNIYLAKKNDLLIFRSNTPHKVSLSPESEYDRYDILFCEDNIANGVFNRFPEHVSCINCSGNEHIIELFAKLDWLCKSFTGDDLGLLLKNTLEEILFVLSMNINSERDNDILSIHPILSRAIQYINEHYTEQISIDMLCEHLYITKSHLHHLFKENLKISPKKYINMRRLAKAQKMIRMGEKPIKVYASCGFVDYASLFRNYVSYFGYSPSKESELNTDEIFE